MRAVVCVTDLRDFTRSSETLPQAELLRLLDDAFEPLVGAIHAHGGEVLKFIGDAVLAVFRVDDVQAPREACDRAVAAAREAMARLAAVNVGRRGAGLEEIRCGLGLHLGDVVYGNIGAPDRLDFTVIGAAVNQVSRIEGLCKVLGRPAIASEAVALNSTAALVDLGEHALRGVDRPLRLFAIE